LHVFLLIVFVDYLFFAICGFELGGFVQVQQVLSILVMPWPFLALVRFCIGAVRFLPGQPGLQLSYLFLPSSWNHRLVHRAWLIDWDEVSLTFLPMLPTDPTPSDFCLQSSWDYRWSPYPALFLSAIVKNSKIILSK
jgi:hypothetical protein